MYIRIQNKTIRFRVSVIEAKRLLDGEVLRDSLPLSNEISLAYEVRISESNSSFNYASESNSIILLVDRKKLAYETTIRPTKTGIAFKEIIGAKQLSVSLEIDMKKPKDL